MKVTQVPPVHTANLVANSDNTAYGADVINLKVMFVAVSSRCVGPIVLLHGAPSTNMDNKSHVQ